MFTWKVFRGSADGTIQESFTTRGELVDDEVFIVVTAAGLCGTDKHYQNFDMVLGHEGIGVVERVGPNVRTLQKGDRVGWGYQHNCCGFCKMCLEGEEVHCIDRSIYGESNLDQGAFATNAIWREAFLFRLPNNLTDIDAAPLMCAGSTVFSALKSSRLSPGDRVGVLGMGGLGHLAIQFAAKQGFRVTVLSRSETKKNDALEFGASEFHAVKDIMRLEMSQPLDVLFVTASQQSDWRHLPDLMASRGRIMFLSIIHENIEIPSLSLVTRNLQVQGSVIAPRRCSIEMLRFAAENDVRPRVDKFPLTADGITKALELMKKGEIRYRAVLTPVMG